MAPLVYFLHIPRTMGTALKDQCLYPNYNPEDVALDLNWHGIYGHSKNIYTNKRLICGHLGWNIEGFLGFGGIDKITMLRDPIYRSKSMYNFCRRVDWHYLHELSGKMTLAEFARDPRTAHIITNAMARQITNDVNFRDVDKLAGYKLTRQALDQAFFSMPPPNDKELLEKAKERLHELFFVGDANKFYYSIHRLWRKLNIKNPNLGPDMARQMNPYLSANRYPIDTRDYEALLEINQVDLELYNYAKRELWKY